MIFLRKYAFFSHGGLVLDRLEEKQISVLKKKWVKDALRGNVSEEKLAEERDKILNK